jgi:hypothetical protein
MPVGVSAFTPLANLTLSGSAATVTFSSISSAYRDLFLVVSAKSTDGWELRMQLNGDTGANYNSVFMYFSGSAGSSQVTSQNQMKFGFYGVGSTTVESAWKTSILDYSATDKHKIVHGNVGNTTSDMIDISHHRWASTSAITSLVVYPGSGSWSTGATFALYGVSA